MKYIKRTQENIKEDFLKSLLLERKIYNTETEQDFFSPTETNLINPSLLDNVEEGYLLLKKHINNKIYIVVDCDVDGFTSAAITYLYIKNHINPEAEIDFHTPEGKEHGLRSIMNVFTDNKICDLIILPDSSSNDYEQHKILRDMGYEILVLDHHEADHYSDDAIVINNQLSKSYPNKYLSGVGVVYKFFEYWEQREKITEHYIRNYLDLVALGEISDMMFMETLENRFICEYGLSHISNSFFQELVKKQCYPIYGISAMEWDDSYYTNGKITQINISFSVTPLINALIRMGNIYEKEKLFKAFIIPNEELPSTKRGEKGMTELLVTQVVRDCVNAKSRHTKEKEKAFELLNIQIQDNCLNDNKILILNADNLDIPNTLTGLCAQEVASHYKKPVFLGRTNSDGYMKGSIRGREDSELKNFRKFLLDSSLMDYVEGHPNAAGASIKISNIDKLLKYANEALKDINFNEGYYEADFIVNGNCSYLSDLIYDLDNGKKLWGQDNEEPVLIVENITTESSQFKIIGKNSDTVRFTLNGITYIKFKATELIDELNLYNSKISATVVGRSNINYWNGTSTPQIIIDKIELKECDEDDF